MLVMRMEIKCVAIDWKNNKHEALAAPVALDSSTDEGEAALFDILHEAKPDYLHAAPPCGTSSKAREKPKSAELIAQGAPSPQPLRNEVWPWGIPGISARDQSRVLSANRLYRLVARLLVWAATAHCIFSVENPTNSWFWTCLTAAIVELGAQACTYYNQLESVVFDHCVHGGDRPKSSKWLCTPGVLNNLAATCPGESSAHKHLPWGVHQNLQKDGRWVFDTAAEGAYPELLCQRVAKLLAKHLGFSPLPLTRVADPIRQTRHSRQLMPEYAEVKKCTTSSLPSVPHKILNRNKGVKEVRGSGLPSNAAASSCPSGTLLEDDQASETPLEEDLMEVGIYRTPEDFLAKSLELKHPMGSESTISDWNKSALFRMLTTKPAHLVQERASFLSSVLKKREELEPQERALHESMPRHIQKVMKGKKILLLKHLLTCLGYDDLKVIDLLIYGVGLSGEQPLPPYARVKVSSATATKEDLERESAWRRVAILAKSTPDEDVEPLQALSNKEVQAGFLEGPFSSPEAVSEHLGRSDWLATPRFLLYQGQRAKPRCIDDAKASGLNATYSALEKLELQDANYVCLLAITAGRLSSRPHAQVTLSNGSVLKGALATKDPKWVGRTLDLTKAYKQLAVSAKDRHLVVLSHGGKHGPCLYASNSIPFGAKGSVYGFLRVSRALSFLFNMGLALPSSVFFDDFPTLSTEELAASSYTCGHTLLQALGWKFSDDPEKCLPFSQVFGVLGCRLDLTCLSAGSLSLSNKEGRLANIIDMIRSLPEAADKQSLVSVIQGHLNYASGFVLGRFLLPLSRTLGAKQDQESLGNVCASLVDILELCKPKTISWRSPEPPVVIFTDASFEGDTAGLGAVLADPLGGPPEVYDGFVPRDILDHWQASGQHQVISQAELLAAVIIRYLLKDRLKGRRVLLFLDNDPARYALLKGNSGVSTMQLLTATFHLIDLDHPCLLWEERVPSSSNIADLPSRGLTAKCIALTRGLYRGAMVVDECLRHAIMASLAQTAPAFLKGTLDPSVAKSLVPS